MRLFVKSKIYRAFPELDAFSDERCERFVRAARRPVWFRARVVAGGFLAFLLASAALGVAAHLAEENAPATFGPRSPLWAMLLILFVTLFVYCAAGVAWLWSRDWMLRRRIRRVLRTRGHCHSCGYLLLGATVSATHEISCPECGFTTAVDPALGELSSDASGRTHYQPSEASLRRGPKWLTPARRRWIRRWSKRVAVAVPALLLVLVVSYEVLLRIQADAAAKARPGPEGFLALQLSHLPPGVQPDAPNSWDVFDSLRARLGSLETAAGVPHPNDTQGNPIYLDYSSIGQDIKGDSEQEQNARIAQAYSKAVLSSFASDPLFDQLEEMVHRPRHVLPFTWSRSASPASSNPSLGTGASLRYLARLMVGRMDLARERNNLAMFDQSLDIDLGLARMSSSQPTLINYLIGIAIESIGQGRMRIVLMDSPSQAWLDVLEPHAWRLIDEPDQFEYALKGEQLMVTDTICWAFEQPGRCRFGRFSPDIANLFGAFSGLETKRLGFYWENKSFIDRSFDAYIKQAAQPPATRTISASDDTSLLIPAALDYLIPNFANSRDQRSTELAGTITMIRIERYRLAHGHYPQSLQDVAAESPRPLPLDPYSGHLLGYKRVDPATDPHGRGYILYSVAADGVDNQGRTGKERLYSPNKASKDVDFILNDPDR
ncbi:MAG: hypothetical protein GC200_00780 [Tepidisphaera sp.]|nr:hypothetical protein [Tepidisphaera sp.]